MSDDVARRPHPYGHRYRLQRAALLARQSTCQVRLVCDGAPATSADHEPPLSLHTHRAGSGCCRLRAACKPCQDRQGAAIRNGELRALPTPSREW